MKSLRLCLCFFLISTNVSLAVQTSFKIPRQKRAYYGFKEACKKMGFEETLIIDAVGLRYLDCMGEKVLIDKICTKEKKFKDDPFVRGYADAPRKRVVCQFGKAALLTISCESDKKRAYCANPQRSCQRFKKQIAGELSLSHHSRLFKDESEILHCYYSHAKNETKKSEDELVIPEELTF